MVSLTHTHLHTRTDTLEYKDTHTAVLALFPTPVPCNLSPIIFTGTCFVAGKTTLTQFLKEKLKAARYSTPPPCIMPLRRFFDKLPEIVRRAYYSLGNYIVAQQIATECQTRAVVMDRLCLGLDISQSLRIVFFHYLLYFTVVMFRLIFK